MRTLVALLIVSCVSLVAAPGRGGGGGSRGGSSSFSGPRGGGYSSGSRGGYASGSRGYSGGYRGGYGGGYNGYRGGYGYGGYGYGGYGYRGYGYGGYGFGLGFGLGYYGGYYGFPSYYGYSSAYSYPDYYSSYGYAPAYYETAPAAPVVINQYGSTSQIAQPQTYARSYAAQSVPARERQDPPAGRDAQGQLGTLIAFPDGSVQIAIAYWTEGSTLHYVTRDKMQKQVALSAIDRSLTDQLNRERRTEFRP